MNLAKIKMIFSKFFNYFKKRLIRYFEDNTKSRIIVAILMILAVGLLAAGVYLFARESLSSVVTEEDPFLSEATPLYVYQLFFLIIGFLIFVSSSIFGLFNYFKAEGERWIMASSSYNSLSWYKFWRALLDSSWPIIILAIPLLLAVRNVYNLSGLEFLTGFLATVFYSLSLGALAVVIIFIFSILFGKLKINSFKSLAFAVAGICVAFGLVIWNRLLVVDLEEIFQVEEAVAPALTAMKEHFSMLPSHLPAMAIYELQSEGLALGFRWVGKTVGMFLVVFSAFAIAKNKFLRIWQRFREGAFEAKPEIEAEKKVNHFGAFSAPKNSQSAIFKRELLTTFRSGKNLFWLGFLTFLMLAQIGVIILIDRYISIAEAPVEVSPVVSGVQFGVIMFFINAFILRFTFPTFSQEGDTGWIIGTAPINLRKIFSAKYKFHAGLLLVVGLISLAFYLIVLTEPFLTILTSILMVITGVASLTMLGLSLGVIFINFKTNDPQKLSTSAPGLGFTIFSLLYSIFGAYLLRQTLLTQNYLYVLAFIVTSIIIYISAKKSAERKLTNLEFPR